MLAGFGVTSSFTLSQFHKSSLNLVATCTSLSFTSHNKNPQ